MEERNFCQCCGMPLDKPEDAGTEADGTLSGEYCRYCYQNGAFTAPDATMDDMIAFNLKFNEENGHPLRHPGGGGEDDAKLVPDLEAVEESVRSPSEGEIIWSVGKLSENL